MRLQNLRKSEHSDFIRLSVDVQFHETILRELWVEWPKEVWEQGAQITLDPFIVMMLPMAGVLGEELESEYPVAENLYHNLLEAQAVYHAYFPERFTVTPIMLTTERRNKAWGKSASFFSGGVDSLYTIAELDRRSKAGLCSPLDQLWLVHGFDVTLENQELWQEVWSKLSEVAIKINRECYWIRTNLKEDFYDHYVPWPELGFGAGLGGVAKCMAAVTSRVYIGSYTTYDQLIPHASTPLVDPLWSCEQQELIHFSCRADRKDKLLAIGNRPDLLGSLRVCYKNTNNAFNCGKCEKCLRTQMQLLLLGLDKEASSFTWPLEPKYLEAIRLPLARSQKYAWQFWDSIRKQCKDAPGMSAYAKAITKAMYLSRMSVVKKILSPMKRKILSRKAN